MPDGAETNGAPGTMTPTEASSSHWTPESVISTLKYQPPRNSASPVPFFHLLEQLKTTKREGWRRFGFTHGESVSDHMYRMAIITMLAPSALRSKLDIDRCTRMALVHDMAESLVGDITPVDGVSKPEKSRRERETMELLCGELLGNVDSGHAAKEIKDLWEEYEDSQTPESVFVHDVDKVELVLQMVEYERYRDGRVDLSEFCNAACRIELKEMREWTETVLREREEFWRGLKDATLSREGGCLERVKKAWEEMDEKKAGGAQS
ncbi:hypothetical protein P152DRAFT_457496 [Eremomyces bilateralis CBS 781.70]|uniref:5'-deoxynucleotidase n=1 Tax=Eremomyces bilateralis CBS 781.70 TaxID=1392243 RepID=A0A6G1G4Y9_9PEZI|nr:uncharacterized protein P152DRAFT_457496 [Eremomyces bilateralis CBS 781.70]KAF1813137.1 hypothetical protein P152DRAFT_457496 [Eremomyces bilateralis CBS 781.70]